jgi:hypothetical protein
MRLSRLFCKIAEIIFSLVFVMGVNPALSSASTKIDAGKLLDVIIGEITKDSAKKETSEATPTHAGQSGGTLADSNLGSSTLTEEEYEEKVYTIIHNIQKYVDPENNKLTGEWKKVHARVYKRIDFITKKPIEDKQFPEAVDILYESQNNLIITDGSYNRKNDKIKYDRVRRFATRDFRGLFDGLETGMTPEQTDIILGKPSINGDGRSYSSYPYDITIRFKSGKSYLLDYYTPSYEGQDWTETGESLEVNERLAGKIIASWSQNTKPESSNAAVLGGNTIDASKLIKVEVTGTNINIRSEPSSKGKVIRQASKKDDFGETCFIVDSSNIQNKNDKTEWYKIVFEIDNFSVDIIQSLPNPYISKKYVKVVPLSENEKKMLEWFSRGRPPFYKTGDVLQKSMEGWKVVPITETMTLYSEPVENAKKVNFPKGTGIIVSAYPDDIGGLGAFESATYQDGRYYFHIDMKDVEWFPVVGENRTIVGWYKRSESGGKF